MNYRGDLTMSSDMSQGEYPFLPGVEGSSTDELLETTMIAVNLVQRLVGECQRRAELVRWTGNCRAHGNECCRTGDSCWRSEANVFSQIGSGAGLGLWWLVGEAEMAMSSGLRLSVFSGPMDLRIT